MVEILPETSDAVDFGLWRQRIRDETFSLYHFEMGRALLDHENNLEAGLAQLRRAIAINPTLLPAHCILVDTLRSAGLTAEAEIAHNAAMAIKGDYQLLGLCSLALEKIDADDRDAAETLIARAETSAPDKPLIVACRLLLRLAAGETIDSATAAGLALAPIADKLAESLKIAGNRLLMASKFDPAEQAFHWLLAVDPRSVPAFNGLASLFRKRGNHRARLEIAERCLTFAPKTGLAHFHAGSARIVLDEDFVAAHAHIRAALQCTPDDLNATTCDWRIRIAQGHALDVLTEVHAVYAKHPNELVLQFWASLALQAAGDVRGALTIHQSFVNDSRNLRDHGLFALQLAMLNGTGEGIAYLEGGTPGRPPENHRLRVIWAYLIGRDGRLAPALETLRATVPALPDNALELTCWALVLEAAGDGEQADRRHRQAFDVGAKWAWLNARHLLGDFARLEATYRRLGLIPHPSWPVAPQLIGTDRLSYQRA